MWIQDAQRKLGRVIAKAWADPTFKERLKAEPKAVLGEMGVKTPEDTEIEVVENTATKTYYRSINIAHVSVFLLQYRA